MNPFEQLLNTVGRSYREADKRLGGWLPGGGTAFPVMRAVQATAPAARRLAGSVRDNAIIPVIDKGIETGILPAKETMFARFLSGTEKPLTTLHPDILKEIPAAIKKASTPQTITNPEWQQAYNQVLAENKTTFKDPVIAKMFAADYMNKSQIPREIQNTLIVDKQGRIPIQYDHYGNPSALTETLGQFYTNKKTGEITDRYDFNYYMPDNLDPNLTNIKAGFNLIKEGNPRGLIPFSNALGLIKPGSGYPIQVNP